MRELDELPFAVGFTVLDDSIGLSRAAENRENQPVDVDRWELVLTPQKHLKRFRDNLSLVQLFSRPKKKLHVMFHRDPLFRHWISLAMADDQMWSSPEIKLGFFGALNEYQVSRPAAHQASLGSIHVPIAVFARCLTTTGYDAIRIESHGQKMPITPSFIETESGTAQHR